MLVAAGFFGSRDPLSNPLPLTVWTLLWVGLTLVQGLFGNLWAWINPWYGPWRIVSALSRPIATDRRRCSCRDGSAIWPAVAAVLRLRLVRADRSGARRSGAAGPAVGLYWLFSFAAMLVFGYDDWSRRGEFLSVFFGMVSRFGIFEERRDGRPAALTPVPARRKARATPRRCRRAASLFLLLALASVSFDGLSQDLLLARR